MSLVIAHDESEPTLFTRQRWYAYKNQRTALTNQTYLHRHAYSNVDDVDLSLQALTPPTHWAAAKGTRSVHDSLPRYLKDFICKRKLLLISLSLDFQQSPIK